MEILSPKTIVISTIPIKRHISAAYTTYSAPNHTTVIKEEQADPMDLLDMDSEMEGDAPRKRKRLTHLTPDQRLMRRKLKNRVAAQTARDRKKVRMQELEEAIAQLEAENKKLKTENSSLKQKTGSLTHENSTLREKLGQSGACEAAPSDKEGSLDSAAFRSPLPQELVLPVCQATSHLLSFLLTLSLTCWISSNKSSPRAQMIHKTLKRLSLSTRAPTRMRIVKKSAQFPKWWGPQQRSWNPSKN